MPRDTRKQRDTRTSAEKLRAHREAFELALELRCTPAAAQEIINQGTAERSETLRRQDAAARHRASSQRLAAKMHPPLARALTDPEPPRGPWWQDRD